MNGLFYSIAEAVFLKFPEYARGVLVARDVQNGESPSPLVEMLRAEEASVRERLKVEEIAAHPRIASWREAYRTAGIKPSEFRSSIEAMARRVLHNQELPSINALVDIGNILSLRHILPIGAHALDPVSHDIALRPATGEEVFVPFGSEAEHPVPGEIIFAEGNTVLTRRWSWRQANHTLTVPATRAIEFNVDGLPPVPKSEVEEIGKELASMVERFCGGRMRFEILTRQNPRMALDL